MSRNASHLVSFFVLAGALLGGCNRSATVTCSADPDCLNDQQCVDSVCTPVSCEPACEAGFECIHGECSVACTGAGCIDPTDPPPACTPESGCANGFSCVNGACECDLDDACGFGRVCDAGTCRDATACADDTQCTSEGRVCTGRRCTASCAVADDCGNLPDRWICDDGHCRNTCFEDQACPSQFICTAFGVGGICSDAACATSADCGAGSICTNVDHGRCLVVNLCAADPDCTYNEFCGLPSPCPPGYDCTAGNEFCLELPSCTIDQQCAPSDFCDQGHCHTPLGCTVRADCPADFDCVGAGCVPLLCRGPGDCGPGEVCSSGNCVTPNPPATASRVEILSPGGVLATFATKSLEAIAYDAGDNVIVGAGFVWSTNAATTVDVDPASGVVTGGATTGPATITASYGGESDTVVWWLQGPVAPDTLRVTVLDARSGVAVGGATVRTGSGLEDTTSGDGTVVFTLAGGAPESVHVFDTAHDYVSLFETSARDIVVPLPVLSNQARAAGISGSVSHAFVTTEGSVQLALSGVALTEPLTDIELESLVDETYIATLRFFGGEQDIPLPGGMTTAFDFGRGLRELKSTYYARSAEGRLAAWSFGGYVEFEAFSGGGSATQRLVRLLPWLNTFEHDVRTGIAIATRPTVTDSADVDGDGNTSESVPDWTQLPVVALQPSTPQKLRVYVVPGAMATGTDTVIVLVGARRPNAGFTPVGVNVSEAYDPTGTPLPSAPAFDMKVAPLHGGLEESRYQAIALAIDAANGTGEDSSARVITGDVLPQDLVFGDFLELPGGSFTATGRLLRHPPVSGAHFFRATLRSTAGAWVVLGPNQGATSSDWTLPSPPTGFADHASGGGYSISSVELPSTLSYDQLLDAANTTLFDLDELAIGYSRIRR